MIEFVNTKLFPHLTGFHLTATNADTLEYKIGEILSEIINKFRLGYALSFNTQAQKHELSNLYETRIKKIGNAGRNWG
ncbi:hypothetical protein [Aliiroseovarius halocynthiae]|uniref:Uncharacterized protein n=1 Tax=Aliiroseovarius halocynthiae TaxID=985055 RepID=A0A545SUU2_9RHOB|nr:hypothetical protein [Aliiroseovarius halocynthiae]TQV68737.1 hypothetical protein FIL88_03915 [Aliiroseovarius halocynthiae]